MSKRYEVVDAAHAAPAVLTRGTPYDEDAPDPQALADLDAGREVPDVVSGEVALVMGDPYGCAVVVEGTRENLRAVLAAALAALDGPVPVPYRVGDPDPTPDVSADDAGTCEASDGSGYVCTWDAGHDGPHVAGDGAGICAVWS